MALLSILIYMYFKVLVKLAEKDGGCETRDGVDEFVDASSVRSMAVCPDEQLVQSPHYLQLVPLVKQVYIEYCSNKMPYIESIYISKIASIKLMC